MPTLPAQLVNELSPYVVPEAIEGKHLHLVIANQDLSALSAQYETGQKAAYVRIGSDMTIPLRLDVGGIFFFDFIGAPWPDRVFEDKGDTQILVWGWWG